MFNKHILLTTQVFTKEKNRRKFEMTFKRIISSVAAVALSVSAIASMAVSANAADTCVFETTQDVKASMGAYYVGNCKFLHNNTLPEDGNPFANQYMAEEANGKYYTVEVTLNSITAGKGEVPKPEEVTMAIVGQSENVSWEDSVNGYPTFKGLGSTIKLSTMKLSDEFSIYEDEWYQFTVQLGLTDESPAKINAVKGESNFTANISIKGYVSDEPTLNPVYSGTGADTATTPADTTTTTTTNNTTTTTNNAGTTNSNTGAVGFVAIPAAIAVTGLIASKKRG